MTTQVTVHVYDMYWTNGWTANLGIGVYHTGVEVHGSEWAYGGHPFPFSGIFEIEPKDVEELGANFKFKQSLELGFTDLTRPEVQQIVEQLGNQYTGNQYHLLRKNCNHFTAAFVEYLYDLKVKRSTSDRIGHCFEEFGGTIILAFKDNGKIRMILTGKQLPKWVNRLASIGDTLPFIERALPKEWLTPVALQEEIEEQTQQPVNRGATNS